MSTDGWATSRDLRHAGCFTAKGPVIGLLGRHIVRHPSHQHMLGVAPTQTGKSRALILPTLLDGDEHLGDGRSVFVNDPKEELAPRSAMWRSTFSQVHIFRPTYKRTAHYDPLKAIRLGSDYETRDTQLISDMLGQIEGDEGPRRQEASQHYQELAAEFRTGLVLYGLYSERARTLAALNALVRTPLKGLVQAMGASGHPLVRQAAIVTRELGSRGEMAGTLSTVRRSLRLWTDPLVANATDTSDFTLRDLRDRGTPRSVYLSIPFSDQERLRPLSRLLVRQIIDYCTHPATPKVWPLLMILDEVTALKRLAVLNEGFDYLAGQRVQLMVMTPSLGRLAEQYGEHHNFLEGAHVRVCFAPNNTATAETFSRLCGKHAVQRRREMVLRNGQRTYTMETVHEPLLSETALMHLPSDALLALIGQHRVLLKKAWYGHNRVWRKRRYLEGKAA